MLAFGCSFILDTEGLKKGDAGAAAGAGEAGSLGQAGAAGGGTPIKDAASEAPACSFPDRDACTDCLGKNCCTQYTACADDTVCNPAYVALQECQRLAKKAANPLLAAANCAGAFQNRGGAPAAALRTCTASNCSLMCGA
jgi:hypothetical protein